MGIEHSAFYTSVTQNNGVVVGLFSSNSKKRIPSRNPTNTRLSLNQIDKNLKEEKIKKSSLKKVI